MLHHITFLIAVVTATRYYDCPNREILTEIEQLKQSAANGGYNGSEFMSELHGLRQRKDELDGRMLNLQDSRRELTNQLETLMRLLTPSRAATPALGASAMPAMNTSMPSSSILHLNSVSGGGANYASPHGTASSMRNLLQAADCVTTAMGSLVQELSQEVTTDSANSQALSPPDPLQADPLISSLSQPVAPQGHALLYRQPDYDTSLSDTGWLRNRQPRNVRHLLYHYQNSYLQQHQHQHHQRSNSLSHRAGSGTLDSGSEGGGSCSMYSDPECDVLTAGRRGRHSGYSADTDEEEMFVSHAKSCYQPHECRELSQKHQP